MRTTLTIDDHIARELQQEVRRTGDSFKETVNRVLEQGLQAARKPVKPKSFVVTPHPLGLSPGLSYDNIGELLEMLEGPEHK